MKSKNLHPILLYPTRLSCKIKEETKSFPDKKNLKELATKTPVLQEMLKGLL